MTRKQRNLGRTALIYDEECPVCKKTVTWIRENMRKNAFEMIPCQSGEARKIRPCVMMGE